MKTNNPVQCEHNLNLDKNCPETVLNDKWLFLTVHDLYRCAVKRLCHCNQACDDCEYTPLVTCEEGEENAGNDEPIRSEPVHIVAELQS